MTALCASIGHLLARRSVTLEILSGSEPSRAGGQAATLTASPTGQRRTGTRDVPLASKGCRVCAVDSRHGGQYNPTAFPPHSHGHAPDGTTRQAKP